MKIEFGHRNIEFPSDEIAQLQDSSGLLNDIPALHTRMEEEGYLLLRGLINREKVIDISCEVRELTDNEAVILGIP